MVEKHTGNHFQQVLEITIRNVGKIFLDKSCKTSFHSLIHTYIKKLKDQNEIFVQVGQSKNHKNPYDLRFYDF